METASDFMIPCFPGVLSVTTFWSFLREFSPLEVCGGGIG
jgi:hypothetical protein